jgi:hypothetical protein
LSLIGMIGLTAWKLLFTAKVSVIVGTSGISRGLYAMTYQRIYSTKSQKIKQVLDDLKWKYETKSYSPSTIAIFPITVFHRHFWSIHLFVKLKLISN